MLYFDIGANVGQWSITNMNTCDKIVSVEASPKTYELLVNKCKPYSDKLVLLNYAVCNNGGEDIIFYEARSSTLSTINKKWLTSETSRFYNYPYREIICKTITIDNLIEKYGIPDLIKIDVEGGEYECITSLTKKVDLLCFEWASETNDITLKCLDHLLKLGYNNFYIQNCDNYTFRPTDNDYYDINKVKEILSKIIPKQDWGMLWCK